jgi:hypothetical protein
MLSLKHLDQQFSVISRRVTHDVATMQITPWFVVRPSQTFLRLGDQALPLQPAHLDYIFIGAEVNDLAGLTLSKASCIAQSGRMAPQKAKQFYHSSRIEASQDSTTRDDRVHKLPIPFLSVRFEQHHV